MLLYWVGVVVAGVEGQPTDHVVEVGGRVSLQCGVAVQASQLCQWTRDGFGLGVAATLPGFPRYSMAGCSLVIEPVLQADQAEYQCQVGAAPGLPALASRPVRLTVTAEPGRPFIRQAAEADLLEVLEDEAAVVECESQGGAPPAELAWYEGRRPVRPELVGKETAVVTKEQQTYRTVSTLTLRPGTSTRLRCASTSSHFPATKYSPELEVRVRFLPKVNIELSPDRVREGDTFSVTCGSKAYPENVAYKWFFDGKEITDQRSESLIIERITRDHHQSAVKCSVENEVGRSEAATSLEVQFPPTILSPPTTHTALAGQTVSFHCAAEGNPKPVYVWTRQDGNLSGYKQNLTITASKETERAYVCSVFSEGNQLVSSLPARLLLIRRPLIHAEATVVAQLGKEVTLQCLVESVSNRTRVIWMKDEFPLLPEEKARHQVMDTYMQFQGLAAQLKISNVEESDLGSYGCFAANEVGKAYTEISLVNMVESSSLAVGIVIVIILTAILVMIALILFCKWRGRAYERTNTDDK